MKTLKLMAIACTLLLGFQASAQVSINVNIGSPPPWGPVGYTDVRYYYLPDVEAYYDIETAMFIYQGGGVWIHRSYLPTRYRDYDLYNGYKVVMVDYRGNEPHTYYKEYKVKYAKGYRGAPQQSIGARPAHGNGGGNHAQQASPGGGAKQGPGSQQGPPKQGGGGGGHGGHGGGKGKNK